MIVLQIIGIGIALIALYMSYLYLIRGDFNRLEFTIWFIIWFGFLTITIFPKSFNFLLKTFAVNRMMDLIMIIAFIVIYILGFNNYIINRRIQKQLEKLVRKNALEAIGSQNEKNNL